MSKQEYCQSCAMPLAGAELGTNADGSKNEDYCSYCYAEGKFTWDGTMEEMIEFCVKPMVDGGAAKTEEEARGMMQQVFPHLKRWAK